MRPLFVEGNMGAPTKEPCSFISHILAMRGEGEVSLLNRVFHEQYDVDKDGNITVRDKKLISASSVQNPHDPDAAYRSKSGKKVKGYSTNLTETCDEEGKPSLITDVQVKPANILIVTARTAPSYCLDWCATC